jgi:hypothetical protein
LMEVAGIGQLLYTWSVPRLSSSLLVSIGISCHARSRAQSRAI